MDTTGYRSLRIFIFKHENFPGWQPSPTSLQWAASLGIKWCEVPSSVANWLQLLRARYCTSPTSSKLCLLALLIHFILAQFPPSRALILFHPLRLFGSPPPLRPALVLCHAASPRASCRHTERKLLLYKWMSETRCLSAAGNRHLQETEWM